MIHGLINHYYVTTYFCVYCFLGRLVLMTSIDFFKNRTIYV